MRPSKQHTVEHEIGIKLQPGLTEDQVRKDILGVGGTAEPYWAAYWNGHEFEVVDVTFRYNPGSGWVNIKPVEADTHEAQMGLYYPIDLQTDRTDWDRAIGAEPNADNDGWVPVWPDKDFMRDHEERLKAAVANSLRHWHQDAEQGHDIAMGSVVRSNNQTNLLILEGARQHKRILYEFHDDMESAIIFEARTRHLGYLQQNPHESHVQQPVVRAFAKTIAYWNTEKADLWGKIRIAIEAAEFAAKESREYETRWAQAARLAAEAAAKAEAEEGSGT